ncbi:hypothetical protein LTR56_001397 [Elasticomyces elasticus]|nr:hypothetical protein LTR56_001397 [Elasticomyces elasticus]KAK5768437.1 hypothetical protein LTS12_001225 [Elasticomyces elasticus]
MSGESSPLTEPEPEGDEYTSPKAGDITALLLERLSRHVMDAHINILQPGNVEFLKTYCSPEYRMVNPTDHDPGTASEQALATHLKNSIAFRKAHRSFWTEVTSTSATFDADRSIVKRLDVMESKNAISNARVLISITGVRNQTGNGNASS